MVPKRASCGSRSLVIAFSAVASSQRTVALLPHVFISRAGRGVPRSRLQSRMAWVAARSSPLVRGAWPHARSAASRAARPPRRGWPRSGDRRAATWHRRPPTGTPARTRVPSALCSCRRRQLSVHANVWLDGPPRFSRTINYRWRARGDSKTGYLASLINADPKNRVTSKPKMLGFDDEVTTGHHLRT